MARKSPNQIADQVLGTVPLEARGPVEQRFRAELALRVAAGLIDFNVTFGSEAFRMSREELAGVALEALVTPKDDATPSRFPPRTRRAPVNVDEFVAGLPA